MEQIHSYLFRLKPGEELAQGVEKQVQDQQIETGWIASCVSNLTHYHIRFAKPPVP